MRILRIPHSWSVTPTQAVAIQKKLASRVIRRGRVPALRFVAGADLAFTRDGKECIAGVVVWDVQHREVVEQQVARRVVRFPYVPGLLTFREAPALLAALKKLRHEPDVFMFDGQGYAHPRRFGLACHMGLMLNRPSFGCAKSILVGEYEWLRLLKRSASPLMHDNECVGMAVRTRDNVKPVYVSVGHRISLDAAVEITLACCTTFRLPEPTQLADKLVARQRELPRRR